MKEYRELCKLHPTFRERSENVELSTKISLQPVKRYNLDGCILFSDILTPLPAMNIDFDILEHTGPILKHSERYLNINSINKYIKNIDLHSLDFVGKTLQNLRENLKNTDKAVLGFVGLPFTLGSYSNYFYIISYKYIIFKLKLKLYINKIIYLIFILINIVIEGGSSSNYMKTKTLLYEKPEIAHTLFKKLADNLVEYIKYQIANGAQMVQLFDSWAGDLSPKLYK